MNQAEKNRQAMIAINEELNKPMDWERVRKEMEADRLAWRNEASDAIYEAGISKSDLLAYCGFEGTLQAGAGVYQVFQSVWQRSDADGRYFIRTFIKELSPGRDKYFIEAMILKSMARLAKELLSFDKPPAFWRDLNEFHWS